MDNPCDYCPMILVCDHMCTEKLLHLCGTGELNIQYFPGLKEEFTKRKAEIEEEKDAWKIPVLIA